MAYTKIIRLYPLPIRVYAEYEDCEVENGSRFERVPFIAIAENPDGDTDCYLMSLDSSGDLDRPETAVNFVRYHISEGWMKKLPEDFMEE